MDIGIIDRSRSLIVKIADEIRRTHDSCIHDLSIDSNGDLSKWEYMIDSMGIKSSPSLSPPFSNAAAAFSQIWAGLDLHKRTLEAVKDRLSGKEDVESLVARMEDLLYQIGLALEHHNMSPPSPEPQPLTTTSHLDDYRIEVTTHVTLVRLLRFGEEVSRFLRTQVPADLE